MNNIQKIQALSYQDLYKCVYSLLLRLGYSDINQLDHSITAVMQGPLNTQVSQFFIYEEKLIGGPTVEDVAINIKGQLPISKPNVVFIVSKHNISNGFEVALSNEIDSVQLNFIERDKLIELLNENYTDFWKHDDVELIEYENDFCNLIKKESEVKKLKIFNEKYQKLLDIFIEPRIFHSYEDKATNTPVRKRIEIDGLIKDKKNQIISGEAGTGKTTVLKKIGEKLIKKNAESEAKNIPIFISATEIFENNYKVLPLIENCILKHFEEINDSFYKKYKVTLLIDSIDELDKEQQKKILSELGVLSEVKGIKYVIGTRNHDKIAALIDKNGINIYQIEKFNNDQIKRFVAQFFHDKKSKADELVDSLKENRIIERMPITPLTLSLISILYEENNLEVPATIADIYDNFNSLIIGRSTVTSRIEFIDISFKERILSLYALHIIERDGHKPLTKEEFYKYFEDYYEGKTLPLKEGKLEEVLEYLIEHTGILVVKDDKWIKFSHDSYMEYYAALEIFKHQREKEASLVENFLDHNWQNAAIFYAGKSKDLPKFLEKIIAKLSSANMIQDCFMGVLGTGYLLQALYQTDNQLRKNAVHEALRLSLSAYEITTKLASDQVVLFKNYNLPILQLMNLMYFYENFNSLTVKEPLKLAFYEVLNEFRNNKDLKVSAYKAVKLALTLDSKRINEPCALAEIIEEKDIFKDPSLYVLLDFSLEFLGKDKYKSIKEDIKKKHFRRISEPVRELIKLPASRLRFTNLNTVKKDKRIKLVVEGKTDAEIIEHAFYCLTGGSEPYWSIECSGNESGGATEVSKTLNAAKPLIYSDSILIGIFDHDAKGLQEYRGLKKNIFSECVKDTVKKHNNCEIYGLCLPVPGELDNYLQKDQAFNFFEVEHYFDFSFLEEQEVIEESAIPGVYKIKEKSKKVFSKHVRNQSSPNIFRHFIELFKTIDNLTGETVEYED